MPEVLLYNKFGQFVSDNINTKSGAIGFEFLPAPQLLAPKYYERIVYSGGVHLATLPVEGDWEVSGSIGAALPIGRSGVLDIALESGVRRSADLENYKENFFKFSLTTSGGKKWKKRSTQLY